MRARILPWMIAVVLLAGAGVRAADDDPDEPKGEARLLKVGQVTPDFTLPLVTGGEVTLSNLLKFGKAVLVGFWAIDPAKGGSELAKVQKLHDALEGKGLSTVMINPVEDLNATKRFVDKGKILIQVCIDGKETNRAVTNVYKAKELPTFYLLDREGKVLYRSVGYKEPDLKAAIEKAGVK